MEDKGVIVSQEGYEKLEKELDYLRTDKKSRNCRKNKGGIRLWRFIRKLRI